MLIAQANRVIAPRYDRGQSSKLYKGGPPLSSCHIRPVAPNSLYLFDPIEPSSIQRGHRPLPCCLFITMTTLFPDTSRGLLFEGWQFNRRTDQDCPEMSNALGLEPFTTTIPHSGITGTTDNGDLWHSVMSQFLDTPANAAAGLPTDLLTLPYNQVGNLPLLTHDLKTPLNAAAGLRPTEYSDISLHEVGNLPLLAHGFTNPISAATVLRPIDFSDVSFSGLGNLPLLTYDFNSPINAAADLCPTDFSGTSLSGVGDISLPTYGFFNNPDHVAANKHLNSTDAHETQPTTLVSVQDTKEPTSTDTHETKPITGARTVSFEDTKEPTRTDKHEIQPIDGPLSVSVDDNKEPSCSDVRRDGLVPHALKSSSKGKRGPPPSGGGGSRYKRVKSGTTQTDACARIKKLGLLFGNDKDMDFHWGRHKGAWSWLDSSGEPVGPENLEEFINFFLEFINLAYFIVVTGQGCTVTTTWTPEEALFAGNCNGKRFTMSIDSAALLILDPSHSQEAMLEESTAA